MGFAWGSLPGHLLPPRAGRRSKCTGSCTFQRQLGFYLRVARSQQEGKRLVSQRPPLPWPPKPRVLTREPAW